MSVEDAKRALDKAKAALVGEKAKATKRDPNAEGIAVAKANVDAAVQVFEQAVRSAARESLK